MVRNLPVKGLGMDHTVQTHHTCLHLISVHQTAPPLTSNSSHLEYIIITAAAATTTYYFQCLFNQSILHGHHWLGLVPQRPPRKWRLLEQEFLGTRFPCWCWANIVKALKPKEYIITLICLLKIYMLQFQTIWDWYIIRWYEFLIFYWGR